MTAPELPPLPEPDWKEAWAVPGMPVAERWFGHAKMRAYALAAVLAERERCACIAEGRPDQDCPQCGNQHLAIRRDIYKDQREFVYCDCCGCLADRRVWNRIAASPATAGVPTEAEQVCAEAYQVVGSLLSDLGKFDTPEAQRILDNLSQARMVHDDVLPWESYVAPPASDSGASGSPASKVTRPDQPKLPESGGIGVSSIGRGAEGEQ